MENTLCIVGAGSTCLAFLHYYTQQFKRAARGAPKTLFVIEKTDEFGCGVAYSQDVASNILNTKSGYITPFIDKPGDFYAWLNLNASAVRARFPDFSITLDSYAPRPLFGMYLKSRFRHVIKEAASVGVNVVQISAEVIDVVKHLGGYVVHTDCGVSLKCDSVFLMCGTLPGQPLERARRRSMLAHPYPVSELPALIAPASSVAVIGSRLSCIDAVIGLFESGHQGQVTIYSRSGFFPSVRGTQGRIAPRYLTVDYFDELLAQNAILTLEQLVTLVSKEIAEHGGVVPEPFHVPAPPDDIVEFLRQEIDAAQQARPWQAVLYMTNKVVDKVWALLSDADKKQFLEKYMGVFMSYRVSIPVGNAEKILGYLESGRLAFIRGDHRILCASDEQVLIAGAQGEVYGYDSVINATGSPRDVSKLDSVLMSKLLAHRTVVANPHGGLRIDRQTYQAINARGVSEDDLYVLGELTNGDFLFTSALDINSTHASRCCDGFFERLSRKHCAPLQASLYAENA